MQLLWKERSSSGEKKNGTSKFHNQLKVVKNGNMLMRGYQENICVVAWKTSLHGEVCLKSISLWHVSQPQVKL